MDSYIVKKCENRKPIIVKVPGSKSITNRALMLAALSSGECVLNGALFSEDSRAFINCLINLGFKVSYNEKKETIKIYGECGNIPNRKAEINVMSAGTAARFLTVMLAFAGGEYVINSSEQMKKRPMEQLIKALRDAGITIECMEEEYHFPLKIYSEGIQVDEIEIDTRISSQYASAILMSSVLAKRGMKVKLKGNRTSGAYIKITLDMMKQFGINYTFCDGYYFIPHNTSFAVQEYSVEPDFSAACYFYAAGAILNRKVIVKGIREDSLQGDKKFLDVLVSMGCYYTVENGEIIFQGVEILNGICADMNDFSDQALTLAAIAPFVASDVEIRNISHIRAQECDRIHAIVVNLNSMGISCEEREDGVVIHPEDIHPTSIKTFNDHRVAMSFAVSGLKNGGIEIENPSCTKKTFENFFETFDLLY